LLPLEDNSRLSCAGESGQSVRLAAREIYASVYASDEEEDAWHAFSTEIIHRFIQQTAARRRLGMLRILNAGAGGLNYGIETGIHLDFSLASLIRARLAVAADIEHLCFAPATLDSAICVGSVINYTSADNALAELSRIIKSGGSLILEYERSESMMYLQTGAYGANEKAVATSYKGHSHRMWVYSDHFIREMLAKHGFKEERRAYFHILPPIFFRKCVAGLLGRLDKKLRGVPSLRRYAANCILECSRLPSLATS
jgi:hypothetical protein